MCCAQLILGGFGMRNYFSALYGNSAIKTRLGTAIDNGTLPHAFLVTGPCGSGKKTFALELASAINCEGRQNRMSDLPCHRCNTCKRIAENNYTDITRLTRQDGKATIGVEEVRLFRDDMFLSPTESNFKTYIIDEADKLTVNAQNALLTVLEEPPRNVIIILLAESADKILTTVKSRAQSVVMQRFDNAELREYLISNSDKARLIAKSTPSALDGIIISSDGRIGRALGLLSEKEARENEEDRLLTVRIMNALHPGTPYSELYSAISSLPTARVDFIAAVESLISALRDIILVKFAPGVPLLFYSDRADAHKNAESANIKRLLSIYEILESALDDAAKNVSTSVISSNLCAKITLM